MSGEWRKWVEPAKALLYQCWYRVLSFVSMHAPIDEVLKAIQYLAETEKGGKVIILKKMGQFKVARWEDVEVFPDIKMSIWVFGGPKNTVYARVGWWKLYLIDALTRRMMRISEVISKIRW